MRIPSPNEWQQNITPDGALSNIGFAGFAATAGFRLRYAISTRRKSRMDYQVDLLAFIEDGRVIPVVGAELLEIEEAGKSVPLYRVVAERLLKKYGYSAEPLPGGGTLREHHELNDAVCALAAAGRRVKDFYRPINDILQKLCAEQKAPLQPYRELALIRHFDLFATATPDDLLARALDAVRHGGLRQTDRTEYAPKLPTERRRDLPEAMSSRYTGVFTFSGRRTTRRSMPSMTRTPWNFRTRCRRATGRNACSRSCAAATC